MKNKKLIILGLLLLFTTGCSITYDVEIYNNKVNDKTEVVVPTMTSGQATYNYVLDVVEKASGYPDLFYTRKFKPFDGKNGYHSIIEENSYKSFKEYYDSLYFVKSCCRTIDVSGDNQYIYYRALGYNQWFDKYSELDSIKLRVRSNHKLVETNADSVEKGYIYIWDINRSNYKSKIPYLKLHSNKYIFNYNNEFVNKVLTILIIVGIIVGVPGIICLVIKSKRSLVNKI